MCTRKWLAVALAPALTFLFAGGSAHSNDTHDATKKHAPALFVRKDTPQSELPFWRRRPELLRRLKEEREIIVSVKKEDLAGDQIRFLMNGVGHVAREKEFCFRVSQDYSRLKEISDHFKTVNYDSGSRQLFLVTEALGYQSRMILKLLPVAEDWRSELQWEVIWGHFKGMTGLIGFEKLDAQHTEMSLNAKYEAEELPLPRILMGFALEVIAQKVAEKMRAFIEAQPAHALESSVLRAPTAGAAETKNDLASFPGLASIKLPPGFSISVFAHDVPNARQMTLSPAGTLFVGTKAGDVFAIPGAAQASAKSERAPVARKIASGLNEPNGVAFRDDSLYVAEVSRILRYDGLEKDLEHPSKPVVLRDDYPKDKWHGWKYIAIGPDDWLYVPVGAPCNVCKRENPLYASMTRMSLDGKTREVFAQGIRNTVGFTWHPKTKELWFTDNGRDMLGDDIPADELNHAPKAGLHFGFPYCHQGDLPDPSFGKGEKCDASGGKFTPPARKLGPHVAALGLKFYNGTQFPKMYSGRAFIAEHGSWNRSQKIGYRVSTVVVDNSGKAGEYKVFAEGWLQGENPWGRPVDVLQTPDGSLLVSDDMNGVIYRIAYTKAQGP